MINQKSDSIILVNDSLEMDSLNSNLRAIFNQLNDDLNNLTASNHNIKQVIDELKQADVLDLIMENQTMVNEEIYHDNEIIVNDIYFRTVAVGLYALTEDQKFALEQIIFQCPLVGGEAVYSARNLYSLVNDEQVYDDDELCLLQGYALRMVKPQNEVKSNFYPNPATNHATLNYELSVEQRGILRIIDNLSRPVAEFPLPNENNQLTFDCSAIQSGIYTYQIIVDGQVQIAKLFTIIR
jgi:hypothetical protein